MTEWNAADYSRQSGLQAAMAAEVLSKLDLAGNERVLDVGCGDGKVTAQIAGRVPGGTVVGVDPSQNMVAFAADHFGPPVHANLQFQVADARTLPFQHEFDLVVSFNALHWVPEQEKALKSIRTALKQDGRAQLRFVSEGQRRSLEDVIELVRARTRWKNFFEGFTKPFIHFTLQQYEALAKQCGLRVTSAQVEDWAWDFKSREAFVAFCQATFVEWSRHISEPDRVAFITEVLDEYRGVLKAFQAQAPGGPDMMNTFVFYQMDVVLTPAS